MALKLYYHEPSDTLGIAEESWDYICLIKHVPLVNRVYDGHKLVVLYQDPISHVPHEVAEPKTTDWVVIGDY